MLNPGQRIQIGKGRQFEVVSAFTPGGQGEAFKVRERGKPAATVLKIFRREAFGSDLRKRVEWLVARGLSAMSPAIIGPDCVVDEPMGFGCLMPLAAGEPLEKLLEAGAFRFLEG